MTETTTAQNPTTQESVRATDPKLPAVRISLKRAEGPTSMCTERTFDGENPWADAQAQLSYWALTAPRDGTVDKTDFVVFYTDGTQYDGRFGLKFDDTDLPAHMSGHIAHLLTHPEVYSRYVDLDEVVTFSSRYEIGR
jgi:hypothetical protein